MKSVKSTLLCSILALSGLFGAQAKAFDAGKCLRLDDSDTEAFTFSTAATLPPLTTITLLVCALDGADVEENLIRQEAAAVRFDSQPRYTPFLSTYVAVRDHKAEVQGPASHELADEVLRSKPGTIAELLKHEALRRKAEIEAAQN